MLESHDTEAGPAPAAEPVGLSRLRAAQDWLAAYPQADVGALGADALPQAIPSLIQLGIGHRVEERSLLDLVEPADRPKLASAYTTARRTGQGEATVRVIGTSDEVAVVHYLDLSPDLPICLRLLTHDAGAATPDASRPVPSRSRVGLITKDDAARITSVDDGLVGLLGWTADTLIGKSTLEIIHPEDHARATDNWWSMQLGSGPQSVRLRYRCQDGSWLWLETSNSFRQDTGGERIVTCQVIDISEEMAAQDALRRSEQLLRRLTDTVPVGLCYLSPDGSTSHLNPEMATLLGTSTADTHAELLALLRAQPAGALERAVNLALGAGRDSEVDVRVQRSDGTAVRCRVMLSAVADNGRVIGALLCAVDVTELQHQATVDVLTGLHNRRSVLRVLRDTLADRRCHGVIYLDLDDFKPINDLHGHHVGDQLLTAVADRLRTAVRAQDTVGRVGGDEFLIVCPDLAQPADLDVIAARVHASLAPVLTFADLTLTTPASLGLATTWSCPRTADDLIAHADAAMYEAKRGRSQPRRTASAAPGGGTAHPPDDRLLEVSRPAPASVPASPPARWAGLIRTRSKGLSDARLPSSRAREVTGE